MAFVAGGVAGALLVSACSNSDDRAGAAPRSTSTSAPAPEVDPDRSTVPTTPPAQGTIDLPDELPVSGAFRVEEPATAKHTFKVTASTIEPEEIRISPGEIVALSSADGAAHEVAVAEVSDLVVAAKEPASLQFPTAGTYSVFSGGVEARIVVSS